MSLRYIITLIILVSITAGLLLWLGRMGSKARTVIASMTPGATAPISLVTRYMVLIAKLAIAMGIIGFVVLYQTFEFNGPDGKRKQREFEDFYIKNVLPVVWAIFDPQGKAYHDCVERWRKGQRETRCEGDR